MPTGRGRSGRARRALRRSRWSPRCCGTGTWFGLGLGLGSGLGSGLGLGLGLGFVSHGTSTSRARRTWSSPARRSRMQTLSGLGTGLGLGLGRWMVWGAAGANQWAKSSQKSRMSTTRTTLPPDMSLVWASSRLRTERGVDAWSGWAGGRRAAGRLRVGCGRAAGGLLGGLWLTVAAAGVRS